MTTSQNNALHPLRKASKPKILIVDDDATIRLLMRDTLSDEIYDIEEVDNGQAAIDQIITDKPDLVLLDVNMPGLNGFDVCKEIQKQHGSHEISIVMVTGLDDSESIENAFSLGATDFISKPFNWDTFPYRIQYLIKARNAILDMKNKEIHLQHIEDISRIITQNKIHSEVINETLCITLKIFSADRAFIIKPKTAADYLIIDYEALSYNTKSIKNASDVLFDTLGTSISQQINDSEYPIVTSYDTTKVAPRYDSSLKQQMIRALKLQDGQLWYLVIQQCKQNNSWTSLDQETFYKICLRLTGVFSRFLLTEKLHLSEQLLKQAQKIGRLGNWYLNKETNVLTWSDEIYNIYEKQIGDYIPDSEKFFAINFEEDKQRLTLFENILNKTCKSYQISHRIKTTTDEIKWVREQCVAEYDENGLLQSLNGIVQDITESHIKKEQEVHNNKMDAIGQLTSGVAHDFGNLMTVAKGNLDLLIEDLNTTLEFSKDNLELLEDAHSAIVDGVELTKQLLAFSRKKSISPIAIDIKKTINNFSKLLKNTVGERIDLSINIQEHLPKILVDPTQFESALLNVVLNSRNAMIDGGTLEIKAHIMPTKRSQEIISNADNDLGEECICIYIVDNGTGMSNKVLKHAIEPFFTTSKTSGTGLGLSMVYGFIKQSSGELIILSKPGVGTTIYMQFPIYEGLAEAQKRPREIHKLPTTKTTILIVEDQESVRQFAARCLDTTYITILQAYNANEAKNILNINNNIDLLFTDVLMPGDMNGHELASWANNKFPKLKILLTTAMENNPGSEQPFRNHNFPMLPKPYNKIELTECICKSLKLNTSYN